MKNKKRQLLKWAVPVITSVSLPIHAQTSPPVMTCLAGLLVNLNEAPKCSGTVSPVGVGSIAILSDGADIEIVSITSNASASDSITFTALPVVVSSANSVIITWQGPAADPQICLPVNNITLDVSYRCVGISQQLSESINLTSIFSS